MRTIELSELEAKCLQLLDEVAETGEPIVIIRDGQPVAQLAPVPPARKSILGLHKGQIEILGDIIEPIVVEWEATADAGGQALAQLHATRLLAAPRILAWPGRLDWHDARVWS